MSSSRTEYKLVIEANNNKINVKILITMRNIVIDVYASNTQYNNIDLDTFNMQHKIYNHIYKMAEDVSTFMTKLKGKPIFKLPSKSNYSMYNKDVQNFCERYINAISSYLSTCRVLTDEEHDKIAKIEDDEYIERKDERKQYGIKIMNDKELAEEYKEQYKNYKCKSFIEAEMYSSDSFVRDCVNNKHTRNYIYEKLKIPINGSLTQEQKQLKDELDPFIDEYINGGYVNDYINKDISLYDTEIYKKLITKFTTDEEKRIIKDDIKYLIGLAEYEYLRELRYKEYIKNMKQEQQQEQEEINKFMLTT